MRLTFRCKWANVVVVLGPEADREEETVAYLGSSSADLSIAPAYDERYYEGEDAAGPLEFGFGAVK